MPESIQKDKRVVYTSRGGLQVAPLDIYRETRAVPCSPSLSPASCEGDAPLSPALAPPCPRPASPASPADDKRNKTEKKTPDVSWTDDEKKKWKREQYAITEKREKVARRVARDYVESACDEEEKRVRLQLFGSVLKCGRADVRAGLDLVRYRDHVGVSGVWRCSSKWACPSCSSRLMYGEARRLRELFEAIQETNVARRESGRPEVAVLFITLTMPHKPGDSLRELMSVLSRSFSRVFHDRRAVRDERAALGYVGSVRCFDMTCSFCDARGVPYVGSWTGAPLWDFHPHLHNVLVFDRESLLPPPGDEEEQDKEDVDAAWAAPDIREKKVLERFCSLVFDAWADVVSGLTMSDDVALSPRLPRREAFDAEVVVLDVGERDAAAVADYAAKVIALPGYLAKSEKERAGDIPVGRSLAPFELLDRIAEGLADFPFIGAWIEYVRGTKGFHRIDFAPGLMDRYGIRRPDEPAVSVHRLPPAVASLALDEPVMLDEIRAALLSDDMENSLYNALKDYALENYVSEIGCCREPDAGLTDSERALIRRRQETGGDLPAGIKEKIGR